MEDQVGEGHLETEKTESQETGKEQKVDLEALQARMDRLETKNSELESRNSRLLKESKDWKARFHSKVSENEKEKVDKMQEANDFKGLWERSQEDTQKLKQENEAERTLRLETELKFEVASHARDAEDLDLVVYAMKKRKKDLLGYDSETKQWKGVKEAVNELRSEDGTSRLFGSEKPGMISGRPQSAVPKQKTVEELIEENPNAVLTGLVTQLVKQR